MAQVDFQMHEFGDRGRVNVRIDGDARELLGKKQLWRIRATVKPLTGMVQGVGGREIKDDYVFTPHRTMAMKEIPSYVWSRVNVEWGGRRVTVSIEATVVDARAVA